MQVAWLRQVLQRERQEHIDIETAVTDAAMSAASAALKKEAQVRISQQRLHQSAKGLRFQILDLVQRVHSSVGDFKGVACNGLGRAISVRAHNGGCLESTAWLLCR